MLDTVDQDEALRILASTSGADDDLADVAALLGPERGVLAWAASLARTIGWGPLRPRLVAWSLPDTQLPWRDEAAKAIAALSADDAELLGTMAACDAPFAWDVLESVAPEASIESVCRLEDARLVSRATRAGVVTLGVPYSVRAVHRVDELKRSSQAADATRWLDAWTRRALELRAASYGARSRATLAELAAALPLASRALFAPDAPTRARGLALWNAASDALFFGEGLPFDAPAFARAVQVADEADAGVPPDPERAEARTRARLVAGRATLERGEASAAKALVEEARALASSDALRAEALRGAGWAALALTDFASARAAFEEARRLAPDDPRAQADAAAGLGIGALLGGEPDAARASLEEAVAIHVVMRDGPREGAVRGMMELLPEARDEAADSARLGAQVDEFRASGQRWREALALARLAIGARARGDGDTERRRLQEARAAAMVSRMPASNVVRAIVEAREAEGAGGPSLGQGAAIVVAPEGRTLTLPSGEVHELGRHGPVRRVLWALARARTERPGVAISTASMIEAGWPGEKMRHEAATLRVYTTIRRLRALGLAEALVTRDDGYLIDPDVAVALG